MSEFPHANSSSTQSGITKEGVAGMQTLSGVQTLETGDLLICTAGIMTLVTPGGDRVVVDAQGKLSIEGKVIGADRNKEGVSSICFKDNSIVKVDSRGLREIHRNGQILIFPRENAEPAQPVVAAREASGASETTNAAQPASASKPVDRAAKSYTLAPKKEESPKENNDSSRQDAVAAKNTAPRYELPGLDITL